MAQVDEIESTIEAYLRGEAPALIHPDCDVIFNVIFKPNPVEPEPAVLKETACYIVAAVLFNDNGDLLMMQEAKPSCRGTWYLPAGRVEINETLEEGAKREVLEETGLEFEPSAIIYVECIHSSWVRVTFTGTVTGGKLKSTEDGDKESMQAAWISLKNSMTPNISPIRAWDISSLIQTGVNYCEHHKHPAVLPILNPYHDVCMRYLIFVKNGDKLSILVINGHPPLINRCHGKPCLSVIEDAFGKMILTHMMGVVAVGHAGKPHREADGLCITQFVWIETNKQPKNSKYQLPEINNVELKQNILKMFEHGKTIASSVNCEHNVEMFPD